MYELSAFILDLAQNSLTAGARLVKLWVVADQQANVLRVTIADNGSGMPAAMVDKALDPFVTSKAARRKKIGLGLPLFRQLVESCCGTFRIRSRQGIGTVVSGVYPLDNVDQPVLGDMGGTMLALVAGNPRVDFRFVVRTPESDKTFDTRPVREALGPDAAALWQSPDMLKWFRQELTGKYEDGVVKGER